MMSRKWMVGLMTVALIVALAPSSFAQIEIRLFNTPAAAENSQDRHVRTADTTSTGAGILVSGVLVANSTLTTTTLTLTFPARITTSYAYPSTSEGIIIQGMSGVFANLTSSGFTIGGATGNTISVVLPGFGTAPNEESGSFRIVGIRLEGPTLSGANIPLTSASLSSSSNNYIPPSGTLPTLITALGTSLGSITASGTDGTVVVFTNQAGAAPSDGSASFTLAEGFAAAWRTGSQNSVFQNAVAAFASGIRFTVTGLPPGMTATITPSASGGVQFSGAATATNAGTTAADTNSTTITFTSTSLDVVESKAFVVALTGAPGGTLVAGTIGIYATMAPPTTVTGAANLTGAFPKFTQANSNTFTLGSVLVAKTTMLLPYAIKIGGTTGSVFNTGIAIANTTADPATFAGGGATDTAGSLTFYLYPRTATGAGTPVPVTSSAANSTTIGSGLASDGRLAAGGTYSAALSSIIGSQTTISASDDFIGYVFIEADFLNAHGVAYIIANGTQISSGLPIMVLPPPAATTRNTIGVESLGF